MYIYIYIFPLRTLLAYFSNRTFQEFPSCLAPMPSLDQRPHIWKKNISNNF